MGEVVPKPLGRFRQYRKSIGLEVQDPDRLLVEDIAGGREEVIGRFGAVVGGKYPSKESSFGGLILPDDFSLVSPNYNHEIQNTVRNFYKLREELSDKTTLLPREYEYEFLSSREKSQATRRIC